MQRDQFEVTHNDDGSYTVRHNDEDISDRVESISGSWDSHQTRVTIVYVNASLLSRRG